MIKHIATVRIKGLALLDLISYCLKMPFQKYIVPTVSVVVVRFSAVTAPSSSSASPSATFFARALHPIGDQYSQPLL